MTAPASAIAGAYGEVDAAREQERREPPAQHRAGRHPHERQPAPEEPLRSPAERRGQDEPDREPVHERHWIRLVTVDGQELQDFIDRYNAAWNDHDVDAIVSMHTEDSVFENHVTGDVNVGREQIGRAISGIFAVFPDLSFEARRAYIRDDLVVQEWTARGTHEGPMTRSGIELEPTGKKVEYKGMDVIPIRDGLVARKDVYSDSITLLRQLGLTLDLATLAVPGGVVQLVRTPACHAGGRGFESRRSR